MPNLDFRHVLMTAAILLATAAPAASQGALYGGSGDDALFTNYGDTVHDVLDGGAGNDLLTSHSDNPVTLVGGSGDDRLRGRAGHDRLEGGRGDDRLFAKGVANILRGGPGDDIIHASSPTDRIDCGSGHDVVYAPRGASIRGCEVIHRR